MCLRSNISRYILLFSSGVCLLGSPQLLWAQTLGGNQSVDIGWWRVILVLLFCLGLAVAAAFLLKRRGLGVFGVRHISEPHVKIIEVTRLNHRSELNLISCNGAYFLIAVGPHGTRLISQVTIADTAQVSTS